MEADPAAKARLVDAIRIAGIQAAKRTADLVPLRPPVAIELAAVDAAVDGAVLGLRAEVRGVARTGLETEALAAAAVAALTAYDLWKSIDLGIVIEAVYLEEKWGGRSGPYRRQDEV
jgi:cyclic pyranopterin phosphate synthase